MRTLVLLEYAMYNNCNSVLISVRSNKKEVAGMEMPYRTELMPGAFLTAVQTRKFKSSYWSIRLLTPLAEETAALNAVIMVTLWDAAFVNAFDAI